jgi:hypothetical protein
MKFVQRILSAPKVTAESGRRKAGRSVVTFRIMTNRTLAAVSLAAILSVAAFPWAPDEHPAAQ